MKDLRLVSNVEVVAVSSRRQGTADAFAAAEGIERAYGDYAAMLGDPDVDVVYLCTPVGAHHAMASEAIAAGKHVLVEKAMTVDADQARDLAKQAEAAGVFLMEAMWMKFNPMIGTLQKRLADGAVGDVHWVQAGFGFAVPREPASRFWSAAQGGGALLDLGIYPITLTHLFMGAPETITVQGSIEPDGVDTNAMVTLAGAGVRAQLSTSIEHAVTPRASIAGTVGFVELDMPFWMSGGFTVWPEGARPGGTPPYDVREKIEGTGYVPMFRAVSQAILDGLTESPVHPLSATVEILDVIDEVRRQLLAQAGGS